MTLTLTHDTEARLNALAQRRGQAPEEIVDALVQRELALDKPIPVSDETDPTLALFAQWAKEDATDDLEEIAKRQREGDELLAALQANHLSFRIPAGLDEDDE